jgi:PTH2 family peptidyl-tRNA hydrolase
MNPEIPEHQKNPKMVIVVRKDLNMRKGKIAAQAAHAAHLWLLGHGRIDPQNFGPSDDPVYGTEKGIEFSQEEFLWLTGSYAKICVSVNSEAELLAIHERARAQGLTSELVVDNGHTEFHGVKTTTCLGIGPHFPEVFQGLTNHLSLL